MNQEKLIDHLKGVLISLEASHASATESPGLDDEKVSNYLYLATPLERNHLYYVMGLKGSVFQSEYIMAQVESAILNFKPYFDRELAKQGITSIAPCPKVFWRYDPVRATKDRQCQFIEYLKKIQDSRGILNAILTVRNWAYFPALYNNTPIDKRMAAHYLKECILPYLEPYFKRDREISSLLDWCRKKTRKILPLEFKERELRSPPIGARPIYKKEAASYIRYFLQEACSSRTLAGQYAEMVVFLSLCLACSRYRNNFFFKPSEVLKITTDDVRDVSVLRTIEYDHGGIIKSPRRSCSHDQLLLGVSREFLLDDGIWGQHDLEPQSIASCVHKGIRIKGCDVFISPSLALGVEVMGRFTLTSDDVENRLKEAYDRVGLIQSTGGLSARCFLFLPHSWKGVNTRKTK